MPDVVLGAGVARYTFTVTDLHRLPSAGLPAHPSTASISDIPAGQRDVRFTPDSGLNVHMADDLPGVIVVETH